MVCWTGSLATLDCDMSLAAALHRVGTAADPNPADDAKTLEHKRTIAWARETLKSSIRADPTLAHVSKLADAVLAERKEQTTQARKLLAAARAAEKTANTAARAAVKARVANVEQRPAAKRVREALEALKRGDRPPPKKRAKSKWGADDENWTKFYAGVDDFFKRRAAPPPQQHAPKRARVVQDPFELLGLPRDATRCDIKRRFREMALKMHPDKIKGDKRAANERFSDMHEAYIAALRARA